MTIKHSKTATGVDSGLPSRLDPSDWNGDHFVTDAGIPWVKVNTTGAVITQASSYIIEQISGIVYAVPAPDSGLTAYSNVNAATVLQDALNAIPSQGGRIFIRSAASAYDLSTTGLIIPNDRDIAILGEGKLGVTVTYSGTDYAMKTSGGFNAASQYNPVFTLGNVTIKCLGTSYLGAVNATNLDLVTEGVVVLWGDISQPTPIASSVGLILAPNANALGSFFPQLYIGYFDVNLKLDRDHCTFGTLDLDAGLTYDLEIGVTHAPIDTDFINLYFYHATANNPTCTLIYQANSTLNNIHIHSLHVEGTFLYGVLTNHTNVIPALIIIDSWRFRQIMRTTQVNADSASGQPVLGVAKTSNFYPGQKIVIGRGTANEETGIILSIVADTSITLTTNLTYTHTAALKDYVFPDLVHGTYWWGVLIKNFDQAFPYGSGFLSPVIPAISVSVMNPFPWPVRLLTAGGTGLKYTDTYGDAEVSVTVLPTLLMPGEQVRWATTQCTYLKFLPLNFM